MNPPNLLFPEALIKIKVFLIPSHFLWKAKAVSPSILALNKILHLIFFLFKILLSLDEISSNSPGCLIIFFSIPVALLDPLVILLEIVDNVKLLLETFFLVAGNLRYDTNFSPSGL